MDFHVAASRILDIDQLRQKDIEVPTPRMLCALGQWPPSSTRAFASEIVSRRKKERAFFEIPLLGFLGDTNKFLGLFRICFVLSKYILIALTGHNKDPSSRPAAKSESALIKKYLGIGFDSDSVFATNSGKYDSDRWIPLVATLDEIDCISPILLTEAKDSRNRAFFVVFLNVASWRGSNGGDIKDFKTSFKSQEGGECGFLFLPNVNDLIRSFRMGDEEISGNLSLKTYDSIDLYPLMEGVDRFLFCLRYNKKSAIFGKVGRDTDNPLSLHQFLKVDHFCWYTMLVERLLARESCLATLEENPSCLANRWKVATHEDVALGGSDGICGSEVV